MGNDLTTQSYPDRTIQASVAAMKGVMRAAPHALSQIRDVVVSEYLLDYPWIFPKERFVEYGPEDEWWCRKYGNGHQGPTEPSKSATLIGGRLYVHPVTWEAMESVFKDRDRFLAKQEAIPHRLFGLNIIK